MNYNEVLDYLFSQLPMFQRIGAAAYKSDLSNTIALNDILGNPQTKFPSIHIAGTNGKGSTAHFSASILQEAGYKTALFTSPHLKDFRERIKINGEQIPEEKVTEFVTMHLESFQKVKPSFFEWTFALATWYFASENVDIAVIETGMGGRLDSTNTVNPIITCITNVSKDHTQFLGNTIEEIAKEKAGIIKNKITVIIGETQKETQKVFEEKANQCNSQIVFADKAFETVDWSFSNENFMLNADIKSIINGDIFRLSSPLSGIYQINNLKTVLAIFSNLPGNWKISAEDITNGILNVQKNTDLRGRWQTIFDSPRAIADIAHNESGLKELFSQLENFSYRNLNIVFGVSNDKDISSMLALLPKNANYFFCKANVPRSLDSEVLCEKASKDFGLKGKAYGRVENALANAKAQSHPEDLIIITGSAFVVAEVV